MTGTNVIQVVKERGQHQRVPGILDDTTPTYLLVPGSNSLWFVIVICRYLQKVVILPAHEEHLDLTGTEYYVSGLNRTRKNCSSQLLLYYLGVLRNNRWRLCG